MAQRTDQSTDQTSDERCLVADEEHGALPTILLHEEVLEPIVREEVRGRAVVRKQIETVETGIPVELQHERMAIERRTVDRPIDTTPAPYWDGNTYVLPVVEEEIVISKRLVLREEIRITIERETESRVIPTTLRREIVDISEEPSRTGDSAAS